jgi:hypothetical protein
LERHRKQVASIVVVALVHVMLLLVSYLVFVT